MSCSNFEKRKEKECLSYQTSESSNVSENRRKLIRELVFPQPGMHLSKVLSDTEESKDVTFYLSSRDNGVNQGDVHSSSTYFSGNDNSSLDVQNTWACYRYFW